MCNDVTADDVLRGEGAVRRGAWQNSGRVVIGNSKTGLRW